MKHQYFTFASASWPTSILMCVKLKFPLYESNRTYVGMQINHQHGKKRSRCIVVSMVRTIMISLQVIEPIMSVSFSSPVSTGTPTINNKMRVYQCLLRKTSCFLSGTGEAHLGWVTGQCRGCSCRNRIRTSNICHCKVAARLLQELSSFIIESSVWKYRNRKLVTTATPLQGK